MENLLWTGKTKQFTGAAVGNNREETTHLPIQTQTTQTGAPTQPLQRWWDAPGGVGSWEGFKSKGKLSWGINTHFPYSTNKLRQHPAGYFQVIQLFTTSQCIKRVFPRKTPSQEPNCSWKAPRARAGSRQGEPRCQGCSSWIKCITGPGISIFFSGTKQTRCKQQLLPRQRLHAEPNYIKAALY